MNKAEKEWVEKVVDIGCICCLSMGIKTPDVEVHHIRTGMGMGQRNSWYKILPLCPQHHRLGPLAFHAGRKEFEKRYGTELELLEKVKERI